MTRFLRSIHQYIAAQINEIGASKALRIYGAALAATLLYTAFEWRGMLASTLAPETLPLCWPFFPQCADVRPFWTPLTNQIALSLLALTAISAGITFFTKRTTAAYWLLVLSLAIKVGIFLQDYRFMGNYHYMPYWLFFAYLIVPRKKTLIPWLIVAFYVAAGTLKFNREWLTGATLLRPSFVPEQLMGWLLIFAIIQECVISFGLVARNKWFFAFAYFNFLAFHAFSWHIVGAFYPITMYLLLAIFPLVRREGGLTFIEDLRRAKWTFSPIVAVLALFSVLNVYPWFLPGEKALTGDGRLLGLNMLDTMPSCRLQLFAHYQRSDGVPETIEWQNPISTLAPRIKCDPITFWNVAQRVCESESRNPEFKRLDATAMTKKKTDLSYRRLFEVEDFCKGDKKPGVFLPSSWIAKEPEPAPTDLRVWARNIGPVMSFEQRSTRAPLMSSPQQFRENEKRTGVSAEATLLPLKKLEILWRQPIGNVGVHTASKASPVADASGVYVGSDSSWFFKFAHDGQTLWRFRPGPADRGIHNSAALDDERVYLGNYAGDVYALEKDSGRIVWMSDLGDTLGASFLLLDDSLVANVETFQPNGFLTKLDRATGEVRWVSDLTGEQGHSSPAFDRNSNRLFAGFNNFIFYAFDATTGKVKWKHPFLNYIKSTPIIVGDRVIVSSSDGWLRAYFALDGSMIWQNKLTTAAFMSSPTLDPGSDSLVIASMKGEVMSVSHADGRVRWKKEFPKTGWHMSSALVTQAAGHGWISVIGCDSQHLCVFDSSGKMLVKWTLNGRVTSQPIRFGDAIYVTEDARGEESGQLVKIGVAR